MSRLQRNAHREPRALYVYDQRSDWGATLVNTAARRGWQAKRLNVGAHEIDGDGFGFVRIHSHPRHRIRDQLIAAQMRNYVTLVQDKAQIDLYDDKRGQTRAWAHWMPLTWIFENQDAALDFVATAPIPLVSKADVGASSVNVRVLTSRGQAAMHVRQVFSRGIPVRHCSSPEHMTTLQRGYVILQEFIPHEVTYRVNAIGRQRAVFYRYCYPDKPVAQTGNVEPAKEMTDELESLLHWANMAFTDLGTKWCALDVLKDGDCWRLLETSLAWPWPSPGDCMDAPFFGGSKRRWAEMFDVLLDELEAGVWG